MLDTGWLHSSLRCSELRGDTWSAAAAQSAPREQFAAGARSARFSSSVSLQCGVICVLRVRSNMLGCSSAGNGREMRPLHWGAMCCSLCHAAKQGCDCVQNLGRAEEGKNSTWQAPKKNGWYVDIIPIKATYEIKIHPARVLVFTELCLPKHLKAVLASTELGKVYWHPEPTEQLHGHIFSQNGNLWCSPWKRSGRGKLRCCCSSVGVFGRQPPSIPHSQVFCSLLSFTSSTCTASWQPRKSQLWSSCL